MGSHRDFRSGGSEVGEAAAHLSDSINWFSLFSSCPATRYRHYSAPERQSLLSGKRKPFVRKFSHSHGISVPLIDRRRTRQRECFTLGMRSLQTQTKKFFRMCDGLFGVAE